MSHTNNDNFPKDAIIEVLARLPVKTLMRFRHVCKDWHNLFKTPSFCLRHLRSCSDDTTQLLVSYNPYDEKIGFSVCLFQDETLKSLSNRNIAPQMPANGYDIGIHGGIIFLLGCSDQLITLWNPAIGEYRTLPECVLPINPGYRFRLHNSVGFGFDPTSDDLKFVLISELVNENCVHSFISYASIYSHANSWRRIKGNSGFVDYHVEREHDSTYLNGFCYWKAYTKEDKEFVLSFHMGDEIFQQIERPVDMPKFMRTFVGLCYELLAYIGSDLPKIDSCIDIWVRKEMHWSKHLHISPVSDVEWPLGFWKDDLFIIESYDQDVLLFDPTTQKWTTLVRYAFGCRVHKYNASLITVREENCMFDN